MRIEHIAIWTNDLEKMKSFYVDFFEMTSSAIYYNDKKEFSSYFLSFLDGVRIELMHRPDVSQLMSGCDVKMGFAHFTFEKFCKNQFQSVFTRRR